MRNILWALAVACLGLGAAVPAATTKPVVKGKAPAVKAPAAKAAASRPAAAPAKSATPARAGSHAPAKAPTAVAGARRPAAAAPVSTARNHAPARGGVQPQNTRYNNGRYRRPQVASGRGYVRPRVYAPPVQAQPSQDRYREIQQALVQKGYLHAEPNGAWDAESVDAMKRFQRDQSLDQDGKINSLSLIALGLGPKRTLSASTSNPPPVSPAAAPAPSIQPSQRP